MPNPINRATQVASFLRCLILSTIIFFVCNASAFAAEPIRHRILVNEYSDKHRILEIDAEGKLLWEHKVPAVSVCVQPLPDGHILYADFGNPNRIQELDKEHKVVWEYLPKCEQVVCLERLANGNTLLAEEGPCAAVEVDSKGAVVSTIPLTTSEKGAHHQVRCIHRLPDGHLLAAHEGEGVVREYDAAGKIVWEFPKVNDVYEALRLLSGNTLIACGTQKRIIEVTPEKQIVWELTEKDAPELKLAYVTSLQILKNGNIVAANFLRGHEGQGAHAFEVTHDKDKKIVWTFADHTMVKSTTTVKVLEDSE